MHCQGTHLFSYFDNMNPLIAILDEALHGFRDCHARSTLLFSVILAVTSRVCRPEVYTRAAQIASNLLALAFEQDHCSLEYVQALSIHVFWRKAEDDSGWRKTGLAIRMAYELGLHRGRDQPLPSNWEDYKETLVSSGLAYVLLTRRIGNEHGSVSVACSSSFQGASLLT